MKTIISSVLTIAVIGLASVALVTQAADKKPKPYPLDTCLVADEKLGADPGMKPYAFTHEGREIKLCCKSCLKDFKKDTAKFIAKLDEAEKKKAK
jgi:hypothetical protein